jgi:hypothetical protein
MIPPHRAVAGRLSFAIALILAPFAPAQEPSAPLNQGAPPVLAATPEICGPKVRFQADYLLWALKRETLDQVLLVTSDADPAFGDLGVTRPLFGNQKLGSDDPRSGLRLRAAVNAAEGYGLEIGGFLLERAVTDFRVNPAANFVGTLLARPFTDATVGGEGLSVVNFGTGQVGSFRVNQNTSLFGGEALLTANPQSGPIECYFVGYRYLSLRERLTISDRTTSQLGGLVFFNGAPLAEDDTRTRLDRFSTRNDFHGAQVGARAVARSGRFDVGVRGSVALGVTQQVVDVYGVTTLIPAIGSPQSLQGGLLAARSNIGTQTKAAFAVVPEVDVSFGFQAASWARLAFGYNFLFCSSVVRPGEQIDTVVDQAQIPSAAAFNAAAPAEAPRALFRQNNFWAQGLNLSVTLSY